MKTYNEFVTGYIGKHFWVCDAGADKDGHELLDVLVYDTEEDLDADDDNTLAIARHTVIDDDEG